ncbi:hypothetical protein [Bacillus sp. REN10]|uniref:hypothetical protein n=1 Tax=Bacillus sp. REN10 TaxID=2782541 RepID=UPI00193B1E0B|nr:hypothetical protein [Bacillus sp. REN10]
MERKAYRGISYREAKEVIHHQKYERQEFRAFSPHVAARSLFGSGLYLINDLELAARYAFCHADTEHEQKAVVLTQKIHLQNPFILNYRYSEARLKQEAWRWKYKNTKHPLPLDPLERSIQLGNDTRDFLLAHSHDGIIYHIDDEIIYYVLYDQVKQVKDIEVALVFNISGPDPLSATSQEEGH